MVETLSIFNLLPSEVITYMSKYFDDEELPILRMINKRFASILKGVSVIRPNELVTHFVSMNNLKHVKYLCENGCPWNIDAQSAASVYSEECLLYLNEIAQPKERKSIGEGIIFCICSICGLICSVTITLFFFSLPFVIIHSIN